ncbi:MAG: GNAT family N-acetyltransferase [Pseudomonadota bacterium]
MRFSPASLTLPRRLLREGALLRPARLGECAALTALSLAAKAVWGYSEAFLQTTRADMEVTPARLAEEAVLLIEAAGRPQALVAIGEEDDETAEITMAFTAPGAQGRGYGALLMQEALSICKAAGCQQVRVVSDPNAEGFYLRQGFTRIGLHQSEYLADRQLPLLEIRF